MWGNVMFHTEMPIKATPFQAVGMVKDVQFTFKMDIIGPPVWSCLQGAMSSGIYAVFT